MHPTHGLLLQLVARDIIHMHVADSTNVGTDKVGGIHVSFRLSYAKDADGTDVHAYTLDQSWFGLNTVE